MRLFPILCVYFNFLQMKCGINGLGMKSCLLPPFVDCHSFLYKSKEMYGSRFRNHLSLLEDDGLHPRMCYILCDKKISYRDAKSKCELSGGMLPWFRINDTEENAVTSILMQKKTIERLMLGLYKNSTKNETTAAEREAGWAWVCPDSTLSIEADDSIDWKIGVNRQPDEEHPPSYATVRTTKTGEPKVFDYALLLLNDKIRSVCIAFLEGPVTVPMDTKKPEITSSTVVLVLVGVIALILCSAIILIAGYYRLNSLTNKLNDLTVTEKLKQEEAKQIAATGTGSEVGRTEDFFDDAKDEATAKSFTLTEEIPKSKKKSVSAASIINEQDDMASVISQAS